MDADKKKDLQKTLISALILIPLAFVMEYFAMAFMVQDFNIFAIEKFYYVFVPVFPVVYVILLTLMMFLRTGAANKYFSCGFVKAELVTFPAVVITVLLTCVLGSYISPYATPVALTVLLVGILLSPRAGLYAGLLSIICALICMIPPVYYFRPEEFGLSFLLSAAVDFVTGFFMLFLINGRYSRFTLTWGAIAISLCTGLVSGILAVTEGWRIINFLAGYTLGVLGNVIAVSIFTAILPVFEYVSRIWTDFKLAEMCGLNQPVLHRMSEEAPGTFNHAQTVANLAENCAVAIGLNPYMARACAYYHDLGKINDPQYFSENQTDYNPHDDLIPEVSVAKIKKHTRDGYEMCRKLRFPDEICKAALEHHGNSPIMYFYMKATKLGGEVDIDDFRYDCPTPTTKYSVIIMICDICESMTRAKMPESAEALADIVGKVIKDKLDDGQFDKCDITIAELDKIKNTVVKVIPGILHKRIDYAKAKEER